MYHGFTGRICTSNDKNESLLKGEIQRIFDKKSAETWAKGEMTLPLILLSFFSLAIPPGFSREGESS